MRRIFLTLLVGAILILPSLVLAASTTTGLVPCDGPECQVCHVIELTQRIIKFLVGIAAFIAVVLFADAGRRMLTAGGDTTKVTKAWGMFTNIVVGIIIVLTGWLIVDTVMKWAFQGNEGEKGSPLYEEAKEKWKFGPWNEIKCTILPGYFASTPGGPSLGLGSGGSGVKAGNGERCPPGSGCSVEALKVAGYDEKQANAMSCLAVLESSGIATRVNDKPAPPDGRITYACGYFQILPSNWREAKNHRKDQLGDCSASTSCTDIGCNIQTARILSEGRVRNGQAPYGDWTCPGCNNRVQRECIDRYDPEPYPRKI